METLRARVFNIQKFCIHDGPGIRTTVFFKGCPLRCRWCSNPESQNGGVELLWDAANCLHCGRCVETCPSGAVRIEGDAVRAGPGCDGCGRCVLECPGCALSAEGESRTVEEVLAVCLQDRAFYAESGGGVTLSGGEAMAQPRFAAALLGRLQAEGVHTAIETTGCAPREVFAALLPLLDLLLFDVKHYDNARHREGTGVGNTLILENLCAALEAGREVLVRIPVIPGFNDSPADAEGFCSLLGRLGAREVNLLPFHQFGQKKYGMLGREYALDGAAALHEEDLQDYRAVFEQRGFHCFF